MLQDIDVVPKGLDATYWADYIEFRALVNVDKNFTMAEFDTAFQGNEGDTDSDDKSDPDKGRSRALNKWNNALNLCRQRQKFFLPRAYPFKIPSDENDIILLKERLTGSQKAYLFLLVCSSLKYINPSKTNIIAREFEKACLSIFKYCLPEGATVKGNWANPNPGEDCYTGTLPDKLKAIAKDIKCSGDAINEDDYDPRDTGDDGIDLVAWHGMYDDRPGIPIAVGQCGCSRTEWQFKQFEASWYRHKTTFPLISPWMNFYFCPLDLWKERGKWRKGAKIKDAVFVDRYRILKIVQENDHQLSTNTIDDLRDSASST